MQEYQDDLERKLRGAIKSLDYRIAEKGFPKVFILKEELPDFPERWNAVKEELNGLPSSQDRRLKIVVTGKFSSGKSSFINSVLGCDLAPTDTKPTTHALTHFIGDDSLSQPVYIDDTKNCTCSQDEYQRMVCSAGHGAVSFTIRFPTQTFQHYEFVDTPGFNPPDEAVKGSGCDTDGGVSRRAAEDTDVMFFLFDIKDGKLGPDAVGYMNEWMGNGKDRRLYLVATFADQRPSSKWESILKHARRECEDAGLPYGFVMPYTSNRSNKDFKRLQDALFASTDCLNFDAMRIELAKRYAAISALADKYSRLTEELYRAVMDAILRDRISDENLGKVRGDVARVFVRASQELLEDNLCAVTSLTKLNNSRAFFLRDDWCVYVCRPSRDLLKLDKFNSFLCRGLEMAFETIRIKVPSNLSKVCLNAVLSTFDNYITRHYLECARGEGDLERNKRFEEYAKAGFARICNSEDDAGKSRQVLVDDLKPKFVPCFEKEIGVPLENEFQMLIGKESRALVETAAAWNEIYKKEVAI